MTNQTQDKAKYKRQLTGKAVELATQSRWEEAVAANKAIIASFPSEADAFNRLGKALSETGKIKEAREAYQSALRVEPTNTIARKNLDKLQSLKGKAEPDRAQQVDASLFIEEMGKTGVVTLKLANTKLLAVLSAGDQVQLKSVNSRLTVETAAGEYLADVAPKLALRLSRLIAGGNRYAAAIAGLESDAVRVIIKETFQDPSQAGRVSFPAGKAGDVPRPYTKESLVRSDMDDDDETADENEDWDDTEPDAEAEPERREVSLFDAASDDDGDDTEFEE